MKTSPHYATPRPVRPKKALGQHFLTDLTVARRIAATLDAYVGTPLLEVGPGMGVLTQYLLELGHDLTVVELDREAAAYLRRAYPASLDGRIIEGDFLRQPWAEHFGSTFCVIGNYPYNISSQIFLKVVELREHVAACSGMVQREVAERLAARPGCKAYGVLTVLVQLWYDVEYLFTVGPEVFAPPPRVQSAVVRMTRNARRSLPCAEGDLRTVVKTAFGTRRKTLRNALRRLVEAWQPARADILLADPRFDLRAEQLALDDFIHLTLTLREGGGSDPDCL